jgi:hypothetical protein
VAAFRLTAFVIVGIIVGCVVKVYFDSTLIGIVAGSFTTFFMVSHD